MMSQPSDHDIFTESVEMSTKCPTYQSLLLKHSHNNGTLNGANHDQPVKDLTAASSSSNETSLKLGNYMLQGWALMGETCPTCLTVPLVFHRRDHTYLCVQCERRYKLDPNETSDEVIKSTVSSQQINEKAATSLDLADDLLREIQWTVKALHETSVISEKHSLIELLEQEWRFYQSLKSNLFAS
jgi:uncharacterized Zn finger protein (UPF0148 family)